MIQSGARGLFARDPRPPGDGPGRGPLTPSPAGAAAAHAGLGGAASPAAGPAALPSAPKPPGEGGSPRGGSEGGGSAPGRGAGGSGVVTPLQECLLPSPRAHQLPQACARLAWELQWLLLTEGKKNSPRDEFISSSCNIIFPLYWHVRGLGFFPLSEMFLYSRPDIL